MDNEFEDESVKQKDLTDEYVEEQLYFGNFEIIDELDAEFILYNFKTMSDAITASTSNDYTKRETIRRMKEMIKSIKTTDNLINLN